MKLRLGLLKLRCGCIIDGDPHGPWATLHLNCLTHRIAAQSEYVRTGLRFDSGPDQDRREAIIAAMRAEYDRAMDRRRCRAIMRWGWGHALRHPGWRRIRAGA
jgi:hypothetical protein